MVEEENRHPQVIVWSLHMCRGPSARVRAHTQINNLK